MSNTMIIFPGQGSQKVGMLAEIAEQFSEIKSTFDEASEVLDLDLWRLSQQGPESELNVTAITQPAILTASIALWRLVSNKLNPQYVAGHSLGEFSALVASGVLEFKEAVKLVHLRGKFMQQAVPENFGAMAAIIGLEDQIIIDICNNVANDEVVSAVNFNSPGQVVIAGHKEAVTRAIEALKAAGAKRALPLPVSVPSHCALMEPAARQLQQTLAEMNFAKPSIELINNVNVAVESKPENIKSALVDQLSNPVRWSETIIKARDLGVNQFFECGPGKVLTGLNKRIDRSLNTQALENLDVLTTIV